MHQCNTCDKIFATISSLNLHTKIHTGIQFSCEVCSKTFNRKSTLIRHRLIHNNPKTLKLNGRSLVKPKINESVLNDVLPYCEPSTSAHVNKGEKRVYEFDNCWDDSEVDRLCLQADSNEINVTVNNKPMQSISIPYCEPSTSTNVNKGEKRTYESDDCWDDSEIDRLCLQADSKERKTKKFRMSNINDNRFSLIQKAFGGLHKTFYKKNLKQTLNYETFLEETRLELIKLLKNLLNESPIKYSLKLESTYIIPNNAEVKENRSFKTTSRSLYVSSPINEFLNEDFTKLLLEQEEYQGKGSGFTLEKIDGILLYTDKYTPFGGGSYLPLPKEIESKRSTINVKNDDDNNCFIYSIMTKTINPVNASRITLQKKHFEENGHKYNFSGLTMPLTLEEITKFEKQNNNVSVNVYGLKKGIATYKNRTKKNHPQVEKNIVIPLRVCKDEKPDHFDLLMISNEAGQRHYCYITDLAKLVRSSMTSFCSKTVICRRCFKTYISKPGKPSKEELLRQHKERCRVNEPITPVMPESNTTTKFENWANTERHPVAIYADFEAVLFKHDSEELHNTQITHDHEPMSYCYYVKAKEDIPITLLQQFSIPTSPVLYRGDGLGEKGAVAKHFVQEIVKVARNISEMLQVNMPMTFKHADAKKHNDIVKRGSCPLCSKKFSTNNQPVRDHDHLTSNYRQTICNECNLNLKSPKFVPCFFHNLSNYDSHFIVTQLGYDDKPINVIPNTEEKFISFSKYVTKDFKIRFVDSNRFMASSLAKLTENLAKGDVEKFKETAKHFPQTDIGLITRKGVYPYEYTDSFEKLNETSLPSINEFYSSLNE
ncbi:uncharacterized protein LOC126909672, partial [Daktulosphaira vitifoliae]|uniref:uncharacterized protein LOC126909672 n=1 Tax=Daktulosphaira vitifoliae TaxID=58002 RepID=UPI0021AAACAA